MKITVRECHYGGYWGAWHALDTTDAEWRRLLVANPDLYRERTVSQTLPESQCPDCEGTGWLCDVHGADGESEYEVVSFEAHAVAVQR